MLTIVSSPAAVAAPLSVADCVRLARTHAPDVRAAGHTASAAALDSVAETYDRRPDLALVSGATVAPEWSYDPVLTNLGEYHAQATLSWMLADGGQRARQRRRTGLESARTRAETALTTRDAGERVATLYYAITQLDESIDVVIRDRDGLARLLPLVAAGVRAGARSPADTMRFRLELADAALDLDDLHLERDAAIAELVDLIGGSSGADSLAAPTLVTPDPALDRAPTAADSTAAMTAAMNAPELRAAASEAALAELDSIATHRRDAPTVSLALDAGLAGSDLTRAVPLELLAQNPDATFADRLRRDLGASAAVEWRWPLADRARTPALAARGETAAAARWQHHAEWARQRRETLEILARWRAAAGRVDAAAAMVAGASEQTLRLKSLYAGGATTMLELLDGIRFERDARLRLADARRDLRTERFTIEDRR